MDLNLDLSNVMVIFGGTGDLTHRKLIPAIYNLAYNDMLPEDFAVVSVGRGNFTEEEYRADIKESVSKYSRFNVDKDVWEKINNKIYYLNFDFRDNDGYMRLKELLSELDDKYHTKGNRIYYLAVAPGYFETITQKLKEHGMNTDKDGQKKLVIEKPFGKDLKSAQYLNEKISEAFSEDNIYRIDHYLGKEMIQNIMVLRFANFMFESMWNNKYIDNIQISSNETVGVENRGGYYESSGALKDMIQNHMLQILSLIAMEKPEYLDPKSIRNEKVKVFKAIENTTPEYVLKNMVRGQYDKGIVNNKELPAYREEERVSKESNVETFAAMKLHIENDRWAGVPFYIRTGKRMKEKSTEIVIQFKDMKDGFYNEKLDNVKPNLLVIRVQPREGVFFQFNGKKPGVENNIVPLQMDFCQNCQFENNSPEAYERLFIEIMKGDSTLFTRWDEVEYSWRFVDTIAEVWRNEKPAFPNYDSGTFGPKESDELLERDGRFWWNI